MKAFVLAAGRGERLRPITDHIPKPLWKVGNVPLVGFSLTLAAHHGIRDIIVNLHHLGKTIKEALADGEPYGVQITYSEEEELLGTGGALKKMCASLEDDTFVVLNSDTIVDIDLHALIETHRSSGALATLVLRADPRQGEFGQIEIDETGRIRRILGQGTALGETRPLMFAGVHVVEPRLLEYIPPDVNTCIMRYAYTKALHNGEHLHAVVMDGYFSDAGTAERYLQANFDAMNQQMPLRHVDPLAGYALTPKRSVAEVVRLGKDVDLAAGVHIAPPVLLGDDTRVGEHATVGPLVAAGTGVQIGKDASVSQAVVMDDAKIDPEARVHRAIIGRKASIELDAPAPVDGTR